MSLSFTIGIARCGKSTYCSRWSQYLEDWCEAAPLIPGYFNPRSIVCSDDIRVAVHGDRFNKHAEPFVWTVNTYMAKSLLHRGFDVIIDGTNTTEDSIWRILNIDPEAQYVLIDTPVEECERRALACGHNDLVEKGVIQRQSDQLRVLKVQGLDNVVESVRERVKSRWGLTK